ncbi:hypothetical protein ACTPEW_06425 [Clostridioides difficile]
MHFSEIELSGNYSTTIRNISDISIDNDKDLIKAVLKNRCSKCTINISSNLNIGSNLNKKSK